MYNSAHALLRSIVHIVHTFRAIPEMTSQSYEIFSRISHSIRCQPAVSCCFKTVNMKCRRQTNGETIAKRRFKVHWTGRQGKHPTDMYHQVFTSNVVVGDIFLIQSVGSSAIESLISIKVGEGMLSKSASVLSRSAIVQSEEASRG